MVERCILWWINEDFIQNMGNRMVHEDFVISYGDFIGITLEIFINAMVKSTFIFTEKRDDHPLVLGV